MIAIAAIGGAFFAYNTFYVAPRQEGQSAGAIRSENESISQSELGREILFTLNRLKTITIDPDFFLENRFRQLVDFSVDIEPKPIGTENPFREVNLFFGVVQSDEVAGAEVLDDAIEISADADTEEGPGESPEQEAPAQ